MHNDTTWNLPFSEPAELELQSEWGSLALLPVEPGQTPRLELSRDSLDRIVVHIDRQGETVRVSLDPQRSGKWFGGGFECRARVYVPRDVRAHVQTNAGSISVRDLDHCELGIKASAGKIDLENVHGLVHLSANAGSVIGREVGGYFDVETQAGSVRLDISDLQPGEHRVRATMGEVRLGLARGMDVCIETHTRMGSVRNTFPSRLAAAAKLILSTEMGSVRVEEGSSRPVSSGPPSPTPPAPSTPPKRADPELERILKMVEDGELSAQDADELLRAMGRV